MTTIAIVSQKGGTGKTTLAIHLAAAAQNHGLKSLIIDADPQATACQWASWREMTPPEVIDSAPPTIAAKVSSAKASGTGLIVIDTPPHADMTASKAMDVADLVLVPCRPSAFDLASIRTTARLIQLLAKPAFAVFVGGPPRAPNIYGDAEGLVREFGLPVCPMLIPDRAVFRHASAAGETVLEREPMGKAAAEVGQFYTWLCEQVRM